jgi:hypothetical protein
MGLPTVPSGHPRRDLDPDHPLEREPAGDEHGPPEARAVVDEDVVAVPLAARPA